MGMLKVVPLALLFLIQLRFPLDKSITYVLRSRYGNLMVKELWKFEKVDYSLQKCKLDLTFLTHLQRHFIFKNWYCFWCLSGDLNKVSGKDQKKKECYDNISLDHTYKQNQTMAVTSMKFQEQNCSYKVFGWTMDGKWLLDFAA